MQVHCSYLRFFCEKCPFAVNTWHNPWYFLMESASIWHHQPHCKKIARNMLLRCGLSQRTIKLPFTIDWKIEGDDSADNGLVSHLELLPMKNDYWFWLLYGGPGLDGPGLCAQMQQNVKLQGPDIVLKWLSCSISYSSVTQRENFSYCRVWLSGTTVLTSISAFHLYIYPK